MEMVEQFKTLRQMQHLVLIRDEEMRVGKGDKAEPLTEELARLKMTLTDDAAALYTRISSRNRIFMSPLSKGNCSGCGIRVPTAELQHVIAKDRFVLCSSCGRILYIPEVKSTGVRTGPVDTKFMLSRYSAPELMIPALKATTREEAITELCEKLVKAKVISDAKRVIAAALERERILTTAVGCGLAFPHMRGVEEGLLTFAAGVSKKGIDWDGTPVNLVIFTTLPMIASPFYLKLLAAFANTFEGGDRLNFVTAAEDAKTLWKELNKQMRVSLKNI